ncbi:hypothetical protein JQ625_23185 [Bradyrhizobium diazoefficiens]|nr:hypothetical protein [Bradyrhizobium diazoefficiens]MBR0777749.1 hypothetical protein [Bradyrhizobium diazoefficiens]
MEPRKIIRPDIAASAIAHLTLVGLIVLISEVHPFHAAPPETVAVDIVTPEQVEQEEAKAEEKAEEKAKQEPKPPEPTLPKLDTTDKAEAAKPAARPQPSPQPQASPEPPKQPQPQPSQAPKQREAAAQPQAQQPPQSQPSQSQSPAQQPMAQPAPQPPQAMSQPQAAPPAYLPPQPDVTVKYGVMLGLPPELPLEPKDAAKDAPKDDGGDAKDSIGAKLPPEIIAALRRHLKSCAKLPAGVAPTDAVRVRLRAVLATDGTLARPPILIEAPPSQKGVAVVKSAMSALQACQPYKMLPADKYEEWKVIDLPFTPQDFGGT